MHGVLADISALIEDQDRDAFLADISRPHALAMHFIRLGEAANRVGRDTWSAYPQIAWQKMANLRHLIAHEYKIVDHAELWTIATVHVPQLRDALPKPPPPSELF
jgi:uncharacterized protein with HEPN domain